MAKLKIKTSAGKIDVDGYVNVADSLYANFDVWLEFSDADPNERAVILQAAANSSGTHTINQETAAGAEEAISNSNCRIIGERDQRRQNNKSRVTVPIPDKSFANNSAFDYLGEYAQCIVDLYTGSNGVTIDKNKAHRFMFAIMALTRCR
jgi:hypothetical protein